MVCRIPSAQPPARLGEWCCHGKERVALSPLVQGIFNTRKPQLRAGGIINEAGVRAGPGRRRGAWAPVVGAGASRRAAGKRGTGAERPSRLGCC